MELKKRLSNYGTWIAIFSFVAILANSYEVIQLPANYEELSIAFLGVLVALGIVNNPHTINKGFLDDK